ncbi:MAG: hypothetical protein Phog2KO_43400 [Phototrophicaceae bacterium]
MIEKLSQSEGNRLGVIFSGYRVDDADYQQLNVSIESILQEHDSLRLLLQLDFSQMHLDVLASKLQQSPYENSMERIAIVCDWHIYRWLLSMSDASPSIKLKHFKSTEIQNAWDWLAS